MPDINTPTPPPGFTPIADATGPSAPPGFTPVSSVATPAHTVTPPAAPSAGSRALTGVGQELKANIVQPVQDIASSVVNPPQDHKEQIAHAVAGFPGLQVYRLSRAIADGAERLIEAPKEEYQQAAEDFKRGVEEVQKHDYRNALSSAGSTVADMMGTMPGPGAVVGPKLRELSEGARPGGDLATPLARDATDAALLYAGEKAPEIIKGAKKAVGKAAKTVGVGGLEPAESLRKAAGGSAGISEKNFDSNMDRAMKYVPAEDAQNAISGSPESLAEAGHSAKTKVWDKVTGQIDDLMKNSVSVKNPDGPVSGPWISGSEITQDIKDSVSDFVRKHEPSAAKKIDKWADTFTSAYPEGKYPLDKAARSVSSMNAKLRDSYKLDPGARTALLVRNPELGMYEDAADSIREKLDAKLTEAGHTDSAELRKDYGALAQMERVFERRAITYGRQVPISLKQGLGYLAGAAGHPAATAAMLAEKYLNSPEYLIKNAISKAKGSGASVVGPTLQKAVPAAVVNNWIKFKGSDGKQYESHPDDAEKALVADPGAQKQ